VLLLFFKYFFWFRLIFYIFFASFLYFYYFVDGKNINVIETTSEVINKLISEEKNIIVETCIGTCLYSNNKDNIWFVYDEDISISLNYSFAVYGPNSLMILNVNNNLSVYLTNESILSISKKEDNISINVKDLCVYFNTNKEKSGFYLENINQEQLIGGLSSYCYGESGVNLNNIPDEIKNINTLNNKFIPLEEDYKLLLPCNDVFEIASNDTIDLEFSYLAPILGTKVFQISNDSTFASLNSSFNIKNYYTNRVKLSKGKYYWRIKNSNNTKISERCEFSIDSSSSIVLKSPHNQAVYISGPLTFSYTSKSNLNEILISKDWDFSSIIFSTKQNNYTIDDPLQTLGSGVFYYKVLDDKKTSSLVRKFFVFTDSDLIVLSPKNKEQFKSTNSFINIKWTNLVNVKNYILMVSKDNSFNNIVYSLEAKVPFAFIPNLNEGEYFYRVNAIFNNDTKITSQTNSFIISDAKYINLIEPKDEFEYFISVNKDYVPVLWPCDYELNKIKHKIVINEVELDIQDILKREDKCLYKLKDNLKPYNAIRLKFFCDTFECLKSRSINFYTKQDLSPKLVFNKDLDSIELDNKGLARIIWTKTSEPVEYEIFDTNRSFIRNGVSERGFLLIKIEPGLYYIRLKEAGKNISDYQEFKILSAKPGVPVIIAPSNRYVAKSKSVIKFSWQKALRAENYELRIFDKNKKAIIKKTKELELSLKLKAGTYTWELYAYDVLNSKTRYSNSSASRILIVR